MTYGTLPSRFLQSVDALPNPRAQMFRRSDGWESIPSAELLRRVAGLSTAFVELGVKPGDRVGLFAANRPEWHTADFAITGAGGVTVPIYFNESPDRMSYILNHCEAKVVFVCGAAQLQKLLACRAQLPALEQIVVADVESSSLPTECLSYETLIAGSGGADIASYRMRSSQVLPGQLSSLIYTSGTTGVPKGVMLTHNNFCSNVSDSHGNFSFDSKTDLAISFLPLAHVYGRMIDYTYMFNGVAIAYVDIVENLSQALLELHPTVLAAVPRVFEKIYVRVVEKGSQSTGIKRKLFDWSMRVAKSAAPWRCDVHGVSLMTRMQWAVADKLVYSKVRAGTGGKLRIVFSGGAPLSQDLTEFFWTIGVPIYQGYGLTETSPVLSSNYPKNRPGSSGKPITNVEIRIAEDGEILAKGPCVMQGYYKSPEATREVLTDDGWFRTGDIGYLDKDNYLFITDRKKDLIKTAAGKFVAPQPIENALKTSPYVLNAMVVGDQRKFIVALIVANIVTVSARAESEGISFASNAELVSHPWVRALLDSEVKRLTAHLAQYETIKRFAILPEDFTYDNGTLTFTMKLKRRVVEQNYHPAIEQLYADVAEPRPMLQE